MIRASRYNFTTVRRRQIGKTFTLIVFLFSLILLLSAQFENPSTLQGARHISLIASATAGDSWPMFEHDAQHSGESSFAGPLSNSTDWTFGPIGPITSPPVI